jgi:DNA polymerase-3 subunit alpha
MLGTYVSDHPLYEVEPLLATRTDGTITYLKEHAEDLAAMNGPFRVGGILSEVQIRTTKDDKPYARIVLEDLGGSIEVNVSSVAFARISGALAKDNIVIARVRVDIRDEEPRVSVMDVEVIKMETGPRELRLTLRPEELNAASIATLREILKRFPGPSPVILEAGENGQAFRLGDEFAVDIAGVVPDLRTEFGRHVIRG